MRCPHCGTAFFAETTSNMVSTERERTGDPIIKLIVSFCPECNRPIINMERGIIEGHYGDGSPRRSVLDTMQIYPAYGTARQLNAAIPNEYVARFQEAEQVLPISPRASATLSRYLLQMVLHESLGIKKKDLEKELDELQNRQGIPSTLVTVLQIMRKVANFGAHTKKSANSAEIVDVEPSEAEVMLDLLLELFDYVFVKPAQKEAFIATAKEKYGVEI